MLAIDQQSRKGLRPKLAYAMGLLSTMPIVGLHIGSRDISFFRIIYIISILWMTVDCILQNKIIFFPKSRKWLDLWLAEAVFACVFGTVLLSGSEPEWAAAARSFIPKVLILLVFSVLWGSAGKWNRYNDRLMKGLLAGCVINCIWAVIDAAGFYLMGVSVNNIVFSGYIARNDIRFGMLSLIQGGMIRSGGFNSDPAQLGFLAPIVAGYGVAKKKPLILLIGIGAVVAGASTTALAGTVIVVFVFCLFKKEYHTDLRLRTIIFIGLAAVVAGAALFVFRRQIGSLLNMAYSKFFGRINDVYADSSGLNENARINYIRGLPGAMLHVLPFLLCGSGIGTASLGYSRSEYAHLLLGDRVDSPYDMENTYIAYLLDTGIVGLILILLVLFILCWNYRRRSKWDRTDFDIIVFASVLTVVICFMFYHYILFAPQMLLLTAALVELDKDELWESLEEL